MYRDDLAAAHALLETVQKELGEARETSRRDQQRIAYLTAQLTAAQQSLERLGRTLPPPHGTAYLLPPRAGTILTLGILSLVLCWVLGPVTWLLGNEELRRIDSGQVDPSTRSNVVAGRICGIIATTFLILALFSVSILALLLFGDVRDLRS